MTSIISRCNSCGRFFDSKRELREHIDKNHRITNARIRNTVLDDTSLDELMSS